MPMKNKCFPDIRTNIGTPRYVNVLDLCFFLKQMFQIRPRPRSTKAKWQEFPTLMRQLRMTL